MKQSIFTLCTGLLLAAGVGASSAEAAIADYVGSYEAVTYSADTIGGELIPVGRVSFTIAKTKTATATATGTLTLRDKKTVSIKTTFTEVDGKAVSAGLLTLLKTAGKAPTPLVTMSIIEVTPGGSFTVSGSDVRPNVGSVYAVVSEGVRLQAFTGATTSIAPWVGIYTAAFTAAEGTASAGVPAGAGYASLAVAKTGKLSYTGKLGDGTALTGSALPDANGVYRLFNSAYTFGGFFQADINLATIGVQPSLGLWNKPANDKDKKFKTGFSTALDVRVAEWLKPAAKQVPGVALGFGVSKNFEVAFSGEGLGDANYLPYLPDTARFVVGRVQAVSGGAGSPVANSNAAWNALWKNVNINAGTGVFSGKQVLKHTVVDTKGKSKVVTREIPVEGVLLLDEALGDAPFALGQYRVTPIATGSTEITGEVSFLGPLEDNTTVMLAGTYETVGLLAMPNANKPITSPKPVLPASPILPVLTYKVSVDRSTERVAYGKFTLILADDLQSVKVNGATLKFISKVGNIYDYNSVSGMVLRHLKLEMDVANGTMHGYILSYQQFMPARMATFTCDPAGPDNDAETYTSIKKK